MKYIVTIYERAGAGLRETSTTVRVDAEDDADAARAAVGRLYRGGAFSGWPIGLADSAIGEGRIRYGSIYGRSDSQGTRPVVVQRAAVYVARVA